MPFDSKFDCAASASTAGKQEEEDVCRHRARTDDDCKARNDAGNQIWAGSNLTAREQRGGGKEAAVVPRHITESMITAKTSTYLASSSSSVRFVSVSPPLCPFHIHPHHTTSPTLLSFSPFPLLSLSGVSEQTIEMRLSFIIADGRAAGRGRPLSCLSRPKFRVRIGHGAIGFVMASRYWASVYFTRWK